MKSKLFSLIALFVLGGGCGGEGEQGASSAAPSGPGPAQAPAAAVALEPAPAPVKPPTADQLPVPEDFEAEVEGAISAKNYKAQFAELDREIEKDCAE